ncbi:MAG: hypothetical protein WDN06_21580 [Asticcacaulis sp.]
MPKPRLACSPGHVDDAHRLIAFQVALGPPPALGVAFLARDDVNPLPRRDRHAEREEDGDEKPLEAADLAGHARNPEKTPPLCAKPALGGKRKPPCPPIRDLTLQAGIVLIAKQPTLPRRVNFDRPAGSGGQSLIQR